MPHSMLIQHPSLQAFRPCLGASLGSHGTSAAGKMAEHSPEMVLGGTTRMQGPAVCRDFPWVLFKEPPESLQRVYRHSAQVTALCGVLGSIAGG